MLYFSFLGTELYTSVLHIKFFYFVVIFIAYMIYVQFKRMISCEEMTSSTDRFEAAYVIHECFVKLHYSLIVCLILLSLFCLFYSHSIFSNQGENGPTGLVL